MTDHKDCSAGTEDGPDTPDEALDLLMHEAGWIDMHGGDHHEDDCPVCRSIAMVRAGLNHAYPPSHAGGTFTDAQPEQVDEWNKIHSMLVADADAVEAARLSAASEGTFAAVVVKRMTTLIETADKTKAWEMEAVAEMMKAVHLITREPQEAREPGEEHPCLKQTAELHELGFNAGWNGAVEECAMVAENLFGGKAHTYCSENADMYRVQDSTCELVAAKIRALAVSRPHLARGE